MHFTPIPLRAVNAIVREGEKYQKVFLGDTPPFQIESFVNAIAACPRDKRPDVVAVMLKDPEAAKRVLDSFHAMHQPAFRVTGETVERAFRIS